MAREPASSTTSTAAAPGSALAAQSGGEADSADRAWELVLRRLPALVWTTDASLRVTSAGGPAVGEWMAPAGGMLGRSVAECWASSRDAEATERAHLAALEGRASTLEQVVNRRVYRLYLEPLAQSGAAPRGCLGMAIDITPRKQTEEWLQRSAAAPPESSGGYLPGVRQRLQNEVEDRRATEDSLRASLGPFIELATSSDAAFWIYDLGEARVLYLSPAYERIWGVSAEHALRAPGHAIWRGAHEDDAHRLVDMNLAQRQGLPIHQEFRIRRPDGATRWILARAFPIFDSEGRPQRMAGIAEDITPRKHEEEQHRRRERLTTLGNFCAGIAHEINNPLGAALVSVQTAARLAPPEAHPRVAECLEVALSSVRRCSAIVKSLLRFCREEPASKEPIDLSAAVTLAESLTRAYAADQGCRLETSPSAGPLWVEGNQIELEIVLVNLLRNAVEAGATRVTLETRESANDAKIAVDDNGRGIREADLERLCDPFFTTRRSRGGAGLGLSIVHSIVEDHGGRLDFLPNSAGGTTASITLPRFQKEPVYHAQS